MNPAYQSIIITLKKYADANKIPIKRARYALAVIHRFPRPYNTKIINDLCKERIIKPHGPNGELEILV